MRTLHARFFSGPSLYGKQSLLYADTDLEGLEGRLASPPQESGEDGFRRDLTPAQAEALARVASAWRTAARRTPRPLQGLILHVALALQRDWVLTPRTGSIPNASGSTFTALMRCEDPEIGLGAWTLACAAAGYALSGDAEEDRRLAARDTLLAAHAAFRRAVGTRGLNQLTAALVAEADRRGVPWLRLTDVGQFVQLGQGCLRKRVWETVVEGAGNLAARIGGDKSVTNGLLSMLGFPVPQQRLVFSAREAVEAAEALGYPVVVKPCHGKKGDGVSTHLATADQVTRAFAAAARGDTVVVERHVVGEDHRLLVVGGRLIAAAQRLPARVIGDGTLSVAELVRQMNQDPRRGRPYEALLERVEVDQEVLDLLREQGLTPASVPAPGQVVALRRAANVSRGGTAVDVTDRVHPDNRRVAEGVAQAVGLNVMGLDFLTPDIARSWREVGGAVIEVNSDPGLRPHWIGDPKRDVVGPIVDLLFPPGAPARVPTVAVTGSLGKTTTCRMLAHVLAATGRTVGLSTTLGTYVGGEHVQAGDHSGGQAALRLLRDPRVEAGVFEMARGGLLKQGMGIDLCDVGAVLNVLDNHVGLDGVASRDDLARVKRLVVENAREMAVLNADDPRCLAMREHTPARRVCLVSRQADNPEYLAHLESGGCGVHLRGAGAAGVIVLVDAGEAREVVRAADVPATFGGRSTPKVTNAMFAVGMAHGLGVPSDTIGRALAGFASDFDHSPGRLNLYPGHPFQVLLDWCDGPQATGELAELAGRLAVPGRRLLLLSAPGNRPDAYLRETAAAAAGAFQEYVCCDWFDLRGRQPGETASLLGDGLVEAGVPPARVRVLPSQEEALQALLGSARTGDLAVVATFYSDWAWDRIVAFRPAGGSHH
jgi:cyanophycin synthetase